MTRGFAVTKLRGEDGISSAVAAMPSGGEVRVFFFQLQPRCEASGRVVIEAPSDAASTLGA